MKLKGRPARRSVPPVAPSTLSPLGKKLDQAFREIAAGHVTIRDVEIPEPENYDAKAVRALRTRLGVSQRVFAELVGASPKLVAHWEQGQREPHPIARRLLDRINEDPTRFLASLLRRRVMA